MAYDDGEAEILRTDLGGLAGLSEQAMFGGLCFFQNGHMIGGVRRASEGGALFRVGKENAPAALALDGVTPMVMGARTMGGFVSISSDGLADDLLRTKLLDMALSFIATLPPK
ncbi:TfoX/Sxy family protein [Maritimibacter sp. UBA3975]|uniref:TfoX/Sxy family protein n=1 Tax=Maritimibacter sp. UBA3975 TaxID=1946833 RepID=UPI0025BD2B41|nr:TfoX/Sxy family protein [Maritimibacter sp. UBA3975]|tara:strand:+ start:805 stop:1143 length:339 start_codon:yes stop_codon:yes gene_type:complete